MHSVRKRIIEISGFMKIALESIDDRGYGVMVFASEHIPFRLLRHYRGSITDGHLDGSLRRVEIRHLWPESTNYYGQGSGDEEFSFTVGSVQFRVLVKEEHVEEMFLAACRAFLDIGAS